MSTRRIPGRRSLFPALALFALGCATPVHERAETAGARVRELRGEIEGAEQGVSATVQALGELARTTDGALLPAFQTFSSALEELQARAEKVRAGTSAVEAKRDRYLEAWKEQAEGIQNEELRQRALNRMAEVRAGFDRMTGSAQAARDALDPLLAEMQDVRRYLAGDLTPAGLASIGDLIARSAANEAAVRKHLDAAIAEVDRVAQEVLTGTAVAKGADP